MKKRGIRIIKQKDRQAVVITDREGWRPTTVEFNADGDVVLDGAEVSYDPREIAAIHEIVQAHQARKK